MPPRRTRPHLQVSVFGQDILARSFSRFADSVKDWRPLWVEIGEELRRVARTAFASVGSSTSEGGGWRRLSPTYAEQKARTHPGAPILVASGALKSALTQEGAAHREKKTKVQLTWGVEDRELRKIWGFHELGTRRMPVRRIIRLQERDQRKITRSAVRFIVSEAKAAGLKL